jgi:hypothetical protein
MLIFLCASNSFEYTKTVDAFNFNFNGDVNNPGAKVSPLKPANGADNFICKNCWAYLGASAFVVVDWTDSGSLGTAKVGVTGTAGFGFELILTGQGAGTQQSIQGTKILSTVPKCIGTITIGGILSITPTCVFESTVCGGFCVHSLFLVLSELDALLPPPPAPPPRLQGQ